MCIRRTLCRHVTIGTPMFIFALLTVFDDWYTVGTVLVACDDWYTSGRFCCFDCLLTVFDDWYIVGTLLVQSW